jgi:hypothetical protein
MNKPFLWLFAISNKELNCQKIKQIIVQTNPLNDQEKAKWYQVVFDLKKQFGKKPDMNGLLFIIGVQELGVLREFNKQEKLELMHIATAKLLSFEGYYEFEKTDEEGWPHYKLSATPPYLDLTTQEELLKRLVVRYFEEQGFFQS